MKRAVKWAALFLLLCAAFRQASLIRELAPSVSLRFETPLTQAQVEEAQVYSQTSGAPWVTFWAEQDCSVSAEFRSAGALGILFSGDARLAFPAEYLHGAPPSDLRFDACAVSTALAWALFGGEDVTGLEITVDEAELTICGVFSHEEAILLRPGSGGFTAAELPDLPEDADAYRYALDYAAACGLGMPSQVLCGPDLAFLAAALSWSCAVGCAAVPLLAARGRFRHPAIYWGAAFLVAVGCPVWMEWLPGWWIPTRWSDAGFWTALGDSLLHRFRDWLTLSPALRDLECKLAWLRHLAAVIAAHVLLGSMKKK